MAGANAAEKAPEEEQVPEEEQEQAQGEAPPASGPNKFIGMGIIAVAAVLGLGIGAMLLGPSLVGGRGGDGGDKPAKTERAKSDKKAKKESHASTAGTIMDGTGSHGANVLEIDNVVVNPAGSEGVHFLMASVAIEAHEKEVDTALREHEHLVKDVITTHLSKQTIDMLAQPNARERLKTELAEKIGKLVGDPDAVTIYLPEFVVQ